MDTNVLYEQAIKDSFINEDLNAMKMVAYKHDNKQAYGIILDKLSYKEPMSVVMPLFVNDNNMYSLMTNSTNQVVLDANIDGVMNKEKGLAIWKDIINDTGSDPNLEIDSKLKNIILKSVNENLKKGNFSFKKTFDDCFQTQQQILNQVDSNIPLEKIFDRVVNEVVTHSSIAKIKLEKQNVNKQRLSNINKLEYQKLDLKENLLNVIETIKSEHFSSDVEFINNFKQKFDVDSITKEEQKNLLKRYDDIVIKNGGNVSDVINDFVNEKKQELSHFENIEVSPNDISKKSSIAINIADNYYYGVFEKYDETKNEITFIDLNEKSQQLELDTQSRIFHLHQNQLFLDIHLKDEIKNEKTSINWDDLSLENQLNLLKGNGTTLIKGLDNKSEQEIEFKIFANYDESKLLVLQAQEKNLNFFDLDNFKFKGMSLDKDQKDKLENNEQIIFEVFDKDGTLQYTHDMKYDRDLNDIVVSPDKGINYAKSPKHGKQQGYYATSRIENKGKSTPKL